MIHWNGPDTKAFLSLLKCVEKNDSVEVAVQSGKVKTVSTLEDIRSLLPPRKEQTELSAQEYADVLETFLPSKEMREYLSDMELDTYQIIDMILGAPVPLQVKAEYCHRLSARDDLFHHVLDRCGEPDNDFEAEWELEHEEILSFSKHAREIQTALDELTLKPGEVLLLNEAWYDEDDRDKNESRGSVPFLSLDTALRYIRDEMKEEDWDEETACWTKLEKWAPGENGELEFRYAYYLIRDEVVFFRKKVRQSMNAWMRYQETYCYSDSSRDLNLPIPYRPGDIVEINCLPFAPVKHVLLLEVGNGCCEVSCLYPAKGGTWETGALKHGDFMGAYEPMLSPLYRIASYDKYLPPDERPLKFVQAYIGSDPEKGAQLWDAIYQHDRALRTGELMKLIGYGNDYYEAETLLTYRMEHRVTLQDIEGRWPYAPHRKIAAVRFKHEYEDEILFYIERADGLSGRFFGRFVVWDKEAGKAMPADEPNHCIDALRLHGKYFLLSKNTRNPDEPRLIVRETNRVQSYSNLVYEVKLASNIALLTDAHLETNEDNLYIVLNGKRFANVTAGCVIADVE